MSRINTYVRQHEQIQEIAEEILDIINLNTLQQNSDNVRRLLARLAGNIKLHLTIEDESLYPDLLGDTDEKVSGTAKKFKDEMGDINTKFGEYIMKWRTARQIEESNSGFADETIKLFSVIFKRIEKENKELYPLVA
ncbi:MAG: hemerythrin domain-containing protein [Deltaproteobacteria bacterium]|nr:hemerythrin domain-containing protein [Deltaproteobacteria bacterium]